MRIAVVAPPWLPVPLPPTAESKTVLDTLARGLRNAGHDVLLYATGDSMCTTAIADVEEEAGDTLDIAMGRLGGQVKRWRRSEVLAAVGAVDEAEPREGTTRTRDVGLRRVRQGHRDDTA